MDILTQGLLGAGVAAAGAPREQVGRAAIVGALAGLLADADVLIRDPSDPLVVLEFHRHFTHALVFVPVGALLASVLLWPLMRRRLAFARLYRYAFLGYALSGVLDACTSYGTSLLLPFSDVRVAWSIVSIVDPVFTLTLLITLALALWRTRPAVMRVGLVLAACYLGLGALQHERALEALERIASERGHRPEQALVKPTFANIVLWRGLYIESGRVHALAIRAGRSIEVFSGDTAALEPVPDSGPVARFAALSAGWIIEDLRHPGRIGDARYAMFPTALRPLWGIETGADGRPRFVADRTLSEPDRRRFLDMVLGRAGPG